MDSRYDPVKTLASTERPLPTQGSGIGRRKKVFTGRDHLSISIEIICLILSILTVTNAKIAISLGQINQLVVVGILLTIMGKTFQGRLQGLLCCIEVHATSYLQNFDAILRSDVLADHASLWTRIVLSAVYILPLGLSAAYKTFTGGAVSQNLSTSGLRYEFDLTGAPGTQFLGNGLSLMSKTSLDFFQQPQLYQAYGFNMYSAANKTAYFLDGPTAGTVAAIQEKLGHGVSHQITAVVHGTVSTDMQVPEVERQRDVPGIATCPCSQQEPAVFYITPGYFSLGFDSYNATDTYVSVFGAPSGPRSGTFADKLRRVHSTRQLCTGTWSITTTDTTLLAANCSETSSPLNQSLISAFYGRGLGEFAWQINEFVTQPINHGANNPTYIDFIVPAVGAALWSRITALSEGAQTGNMVSPSYFVQPIQVVETASTLKQSSVLIFILAIYPVACLVAIGVRSLAFYGTPIDQGFGSVALMAGSVPGNDDRLRGAALSGKTKRAVSLGFQVDHHGVNTESGTVSYVVGWKGRTGGVIRHGVEYS